MNKILATDLDGTLFYPNKVKTAIPAKNTKFLRKWIDEGNKVVLVTSRSQQFIENLSKEIGRDCDYLACSGAKIISDKKEIRNIALPNKKIIEALKTLDEKYHPIGYFLNTEKYPCIIKSNSNVGRLIMFFYRLWYKFQFKRREPYILDNALFDKEIQEGRVYKVMVFFGLGHGKKKFTKELNKVFREEYSEMEFSWSKKVNEITPLGCNKGDSLEFYCRSLGVDQKDVIVVGDSGNDISMFTKFYENSYCMRKAYTSVRKYAKYTIKRVHKLDNVLKGE